MLTILGPWTAVRTAERHLKFLCLLGLFLLSDVVPLLSVLCCRELVKRGTFHSASGQGSVVLS
jgi:hypothetical protein